MLSIGVELEGHVYKDGQPVDLYHWLGDGGQRLVQGAGVVQTDVGAHQIELTLEPTTSAMEVRRQMEVALDILPKDWTLVFEGKDPYGANFHLSPKDRLGAIWEAVRCEVGPGWEKILQMRSWASLQIHFGACPTTMAGVRLINRLNNLAPALAIVFSNPFPSPRLRDQPWDGWASPERLPAPRWFSTPAELMEAILKIPQLLIQNEGVWEPCLKPLGEINLIHEGTVWWIVRPRYGFGTAEFRPLDSMPPERAIPTIAIIHRLAEECLKMTNFPAIPEDVWWEMVRQPEDILLARRYLAPFNIT